MHVPLTDSTRHFLNSERLQQIKPGAYLINAARGGIVDEEALLDALEAGHLAGAALDVFEHEPPKDSPLLRHPRLVSTPHLGASTLEAQAMAGLDVAEGVITALAGGTPRYAVNAPFVPPEEWSVLAPYMSLAQRMGALCTGLVHDPVRQYVIEYRGELADVNTEPLRLAMLQGLLSDLCEQRVTLVNAPILARQRGLKYQEMTGASESFAGHLVLRAETAQGPREFVGTILHNQPHIVVADGYWVSFVPEGPLMFTYHRDRPGMIGRVGTLLGQADVNISSMDVGRLSPRERAMMVLRLDDPVPPEVLRKVIEEADIDVAYSIVL